LSTETGGFAVSQIMSLAKEFVKLSLAGEERDPLTNLRLQKLLYYAQAWSIVIRESELFQEEICAWRHGPVVPEVYRALPDQGATAIPPEAFADAPDLEADEAAFVKSVWEAYNQFSAIKLSRMTHEEIPWKKAWGGRPVDGTGNDPIQIEDLEEFFGTQAMPAPLAAYAHDLRKREEETTRKLLGIAPISADRLMSASNSYTPAARRLATAGG
jgi:uncharacterized phage-associated protein